MIIFQPTFRISIPKEIIMILLALFSTGLVLFEITHDVSGLEYLWFGIIDMVIAGIFLLDFLVGWYRADDVKEFWKRRWWELFACIPFTTPFTQTLRGVGILRLLRVVRIVSRVRRVSHFVDTLQFKLFSLAVTVGVLSLLSAVVFHSFEFGTSPMVHNLFDSVWWAMGTVSSVGYGDIYPVTTGGRIVGMFLMIVGVSTLGVLVNALVQHRRGVSVNI